jgi:enamine deaminase RidA (YjgF/YER057c/UK114 family)
MAARDDAKLSRLSRKGKKTMATHPSNIRFINPPTLAKPPGYTHVVEVTRGRTVFLSGQVAFDLSRNIVGLHDFRAQAEQVFENIKAALASVGADFTHVVKLNMYVVDMSQLPVLSEVRDRYVNLQNPPTSTLVEVRRLAREEILLEIEAVAHLPE